MNKGQATKVQRRLLAVRKALSKADEAISELDKEDREAFSDPMAHLWHGLHGKALRVIYDQYPELQPDTEDVDGIDTYLRWEEATLPPSISEADLDAIILSKLKPRSLKVTKVISDVWHSLNERGLSIDLQIIAARIRWLADTDRIESVGDVRQWRYSEIALTS
jgi:hypothetical protein